MFETSQLIWKFRQFEKFRYKFLSWHEWFIHENYAL